jgi:hypothetical protein
MIAVIAQASLYLLALADPIISQRSPLKKASMPCRVFGSYLWAAVRALAIFFVPPQQIWKPTQAERPRLP